MALRGTSQAPMRYRVSPALGHEICAAIGVLSKVDVFDVRHFEMTVIIWLDWKLSNGPRTARPHQHNDLQPKPSGLTDSRVVFKLDQREHFWHGMR
jgi:hypothetical protein